MDYNFTAKDLRQWLADNRAILKDRSSDEVANLAHAVGFEWSVIAEVLSHFHDAMAGSSFERRAAMGFDLEFKAIDRASGKESLMPQWMHLVDYAETGKEWAA